MTGMRRGVAALVAVSVLFGVQLARAELVQRTGAAAGSVISRKSGEQARFIEVRAWRDVDVHQDLLAGDVLRTNAIGHLAILFSDRTQLRLGRNTTLLVKHIGDSSDSVFGLEAGSIWGRAERGGEGLTVETPAASAAIRGTDFSLNVEGDKTSLIVLEGEVSLSNEHGSVNVAGGEAAVARIGQAPTKIIIVDPDDREQMLFYLTLRGAFTFLPASPLRTDEMRGEHARLAATDPARRGGEDRVALAETSLSIAGRAGAADALADARRYPLTRRQRARLDLVEAMILGSRQKYSEAAALFDRAAPVLDPQRRQVAAYGGYFARALADPDRAEKPPVASGGPYGALADAYAAGFLRDVLGAIEVLKRAEQRFPDDPTLPAARAQFALLMDDREQVGEAVGRALAIDPDHPLALEARANYRAGMESDLEGALEDLEKAASLTPGSSTIWNALGLVHGERGASREAEAALKRAIELDPEDPVSHANLAIHYLEQDRLAEAKAEIDRAIAVDPTFDVALIARGRYHMQTGEIDKAVADLLAGTTANPAYAQGLLLLGAAHYESGDREPAAQALENADRLDPNDPVVSSFRTAVALDGYDANAAIESARETVRRSRLRGGVYAPLSANREAGSMLNSAFRLQGLNEWGRFYGDAVLDPFAGATFVDQAISGSAAPFAADLNWGGAQLIEPDINDLGFSSLFQGLMASPEMLAGRSRAANLFRRPFVEASFGGGGISMDRGGGWTGEAEVQAFAAEPFPWSLYLKGNYVNSNEFRERFDLGGEFPYVGFDLGYEEWSGLGYLTASPTPNDRVVTYADVSRPQAQFADAVVLFNDPLIPFGASTYDRTVNTAYGRAGVGWSHTFGYRNVFNAALFGADLQQSSLEQGILFNPALVPIGINTVEADVAQRSYLGALNHTVATGDITWRYGVEAGNLRQFRGETSTVINVNAPPVVTPVARDLDLAFGRAYVDAIWNIAPDLKAEAALFGTRFDGSFEQQMLDPRAGFAWSPLSGHWLAAGFQRDTYGINETTLSPVGVVGLQPNQIPLDIGGQVDTFAARWNAEWTSRVFTSIDYQHQDMQGLSITVPASVVTIDLSAGELDRLSATANLWLGHGFGLFGTVAFARSRNLDPSSPGFGGALPLVPGTSGRVGLSWVHPANVKATVAGSYVGSRLGTATGEEVLAAYWTADAFLTWEPLDKRFSLELAGYNLFDASFDVGQLTPGWSRTFTGTLKVRF